MKLLRCFFVILPALLGSAPAALAAGNAPTVYSVELIVFRYTDPQAGSLETWPANPGTPDWQNALPMTAAASAAGAAVLTPETFRLSYDWRRLQRSHDYQPLLHLSWTEPAVERPVAPWLRIGMPPTTAAPTPATAAVPVPVQPASSVYGVAKLSTTGPYLHFDLDLVYCGPSAAHLMAPAPASATATAAVAAAPICQPYRLNQGRKIDAGKLNYFDHPLFGALVLVTPVKNP